MNDDIISFDKIYYIIKFQLLKKFYLKYYKVMYK